MTVKKELNEEEKMTLMCYQLVNDLKDLRESKGLTTYKLSIISGIAQPNITRMETGEANPNLKTIARLAVALGAEIKLIK